MGAKLAGPAAGSKFNVEQNSEINVTPFVDVMLVLLIIFMVAAPLATVSVTLTLPEAIAPVTPNPPKPVYISIQQSGNIYVGDFATSVDSLGEDLRTQIGTRNPEKERIFIRADRQTVYRDFMRVMNTLQDNGFYSVALIGTEGRS
jgi:biopolymer transport protein ExbD